MNRSEQQPHSEQNNGPSIEELRGSLANNGWKIVTGKVGEDDERFLLKRSYNANNTLLQQGNWFDAVVKYYERDDISTEHKGIVPGHSSGTDERNVFLQIDINNRAQLMHALELDKWLRDWGFEDREDSVRQLRQSA